MKSVARTHRNAMTTGIVVPSAPTLGDGAMVRTINRTRRPIVTVFVFSIFACCSVTTAIAQKAPEPIYPDVWYREDAAIGKAQAYFSARSASAPSSLPALLFVGNTEKSRCYSENRIDICTDQVVFDFFSNKKRYVKSITHSFNAVSWQLHSYDGKVDDVLSPSRIDFVSQMLKPVSAEEKEYLTSKLNISMDASISALSGKGYFVEEVVGVSAPFMRGNDQAIPVSFPCEPARTGFAFYSPEGKLVWRAVFVRLNKHAQRQAQRRGCQFHLKQYELEEAAAPAFLPDGTVVLSGNGFALRIDPLTGKSPVLPSSMRTVDTAQLQQFKTALYANISIGMHSFLDANEESGYLYLMLQYFIFPEELIH